MSHARAREHVCVQSLGSTRVGSGRERKKTKFCHNFVILHIVINEIKIIVLIILMARESTRDVSTPFRVAAAAREAV